MESSASRVCVSAGAQSAPSPRNAKQLHKTGRSSVVVGDQASCSEPLACIGEDDDLRCGCDEAADCDDGVGCTDDACTDGDCSNTPNDANCDNGLFCDGTETCDATNDCLDGVPPVMDDSIACTDDVCDEQTGELLNATMNLFDARIEDLFGNRLEAVRVDEQVLVAADLQNRCDDRDADFVYVVDIRGPKPATR